MILLLETATNICSAALSEGGSVLSILECSEPNAHSSKLATFIDKLFKSSDRPKEALRAVCVSSGPGSYTGLRIGVSSAKGICYALDIPLIAVPTLQSMALQYFDLHSDYDGLVCPMIDARRMECFTAIYSRSGTVRKTEAEIISEGCFNQWLDNQRVCFIGDGAAKTKPILGVHPNAIYDCEFRISAKGMAGIAEKKLLAGETEDVAYFEPFYLKDFVAKKSVVHGLR